MNKYSVMATGKGMGSNSVCKTLGEIIDAVADGLEYDLDIKIVKISSGSTGEPRLTGNSGKDVLVSAETSP